MAVILRALYEAAGTVDRAFTAIGLRYDISVPGVDAEEVSHRGVYPWYPEDGESLRFYCMEIGLPHPIAEVAGYPSEIRLYLGVKPHEQGFTVEASIEVDLNTPLYRLPAGEHKIMSRVVEETTVSGVVAAIGRCRDAFAEHYGLFDDAAVDQRSRAPGMARLSDVATTCPTAKISPSNAIGGISRLRSS